MRWLAALVGMCLAFQAVPSVARGARDIQSDIDIDLLVNPVRVSVNDARAINATLPVAPFIVVPVAVPDQALAGKVYEQAVAQEILQLIPAFGGVALPDLWGTAYMIYGARSDVVGALNVGRGLALPDSLRGGLTGHIPGAIDILSSGVPPVNPHNFQVQTHTQTITTHTINPPTPSFSVGGYRY